jgi:DNA invertase Pin-like site-specific DNA recombinase
MTKKSAVAYYRTSSASNVGEDKDSQKRQRDAVASYAKRHKLEIVREFYDAAVSGADHVQTRDGFNAMLDYMLGNGARVVLVENASRFARDIAVQVTGHDLLKKHGIELIPVDAPSHFLEDTPTATMVRNILGVVSQFEKQNLVLKLRKARDRKSNTLGRRIEGAKWMQKQGYPLEAIKAAQAAVRDAKRRKRKTSLRKISAVLEAQGLVGPSGKPYGAQSIQAMLGKGSQPK